MKKQVKEKQYSPSSSGSSVNSAVISSNNVSVFSKLFSHIILILRRLFGFLGLYSYLKVHPSLGWRSSTFSNSYNSNHNGSSSINKAKLRISYIHALRTITYLSTLSIVLLFIATIIPIYTKSNQAEATTGTATASTLTFTSTSSTASVSLNVNSADGTFATSSDGSGINGNSNIDERASFSISTNNYTGYTLKIKSSTCSTVDNCKLGGVFPSIESSKTASNFTTNAWGYIPNYYNATGDTPATNTTTYYPAPTTTDTILRVTSSANDTAHNYTIGLGIKADYTNASGTYAFDSGTFVLEYVANPVAYSISYVDNSGEATGMPATQAGSVSATSITLSSTVPTLSGFIFKGWCSVSTNDDTCSGTVYNPNGDGTNLTYGIDLTSSNSNVSVYAMWWKQPTMQEWTGCSSLSAGETIDLTDTRDGTEYTVVKIGDYCVMQENLAISGTSTGTGKIPAEGSNFTGSDITPNYTTYTYFTSSYITSKVLVADATFGAYYNYCMATAGTACTDINTTWTATADICPANWKIPSNKAWTAIKNSTNAASYFAAQLSGYRISSASAFGTTYGYYWSRTSYSTKYPYSLQANASALTMVNSSTNFRYYGQTIRCMYAPKNINVTVNAGTNVSTVAVNGSTASASVSGTYQSDADLTLTANATAGYGAPYTWSVSGSGTLAETSTLTNTNTFAVGTSTGTVTVTASKALTVNLGTGIYGVIVKSGSPSGTTLGTVTSNGGTATCLSGTSCYLLPLYQSGYTHSSTTASGGTVTSGTYGYYYYTMNASATNSVTVTGTALTTATTDSSLTAMQNLALNSCPAVPTAVRDTRDNSVYYIQRLADGRCWMLENLRLASGTLTSTNSNVSSSFTLPTSGTTCFTTTSNCDRSGDSTHTGYTVAAINSASKTTTTTGYGAGRNYIGVYYNFCAASAGTICTASNSSNASYSVCPAGWKMPTRGSSGQYQALYTAYDSNQANFRYALSTPLSGGFNSGSAYGQGSGGSGMFWSSTRFSSGGMYYLSVSSTSVDDYSANATRGLSVRCIVGS